MPPAAPHARKLMIRRGGILNHCPRLDPNEAPIWTIGPSEPADPPVPMVSADAMDLTTATIGRIRPPLVRTAFITSGTPCPFASRAHR